MQHSRPTLVLSLFLVSSFASAAERDEAKAMNYLYCARVTGVQATLAREGRNAAAANGFGQMRTHFMIAAAMKSDGEFIKREIPNVVQKFDAQHPVNTNDGAALAKGVALLKKETEECSGAWLSDVRYFIGWEKKSGAGNSTAPK